jgi:hypothetical protein
MNRQRQSGLATVEFALVSTALFVMMFGVLEIGRAYFVYATLDEVTRRGARLAAVCPVNDPAVPRLAVFNSSADASNSDIVVGLSPTHVIIEYLDDSNALVANPGDPAQFLQIRYVRARLANYQHQFSVPFVTGLANILMPEFAAVLPRESLGVPRDGEITPC